MSHYRKEITRITRRVSNQVVLLDLLFVCPTRWLQVAIQANPTRWLQVAIQAKIKINRLMIRDVCKCKIQYFSFGMIVGVHLCFDMTILNGECVICLGMFLDVMSSSTSIYHFPSNLLLNLQLVIFVNREWIVLVDVKFAVKFLGPP